MANLDERPLLEAWLDQLILAYRWKARILLKRSRIPTVAHEATSYMRLQTT